MKKTILVLVAILSLGLVSCDRDERVLEVEKIVEKEVEKPSVLLGEWKFTEIKGFDGKTRPASEGECIAESTITFTDDAYTMKLVEGTNGNCTPAVASGKYLYGEKLGVIYLKPDNIDAVDGGYPLTLEGDKIMLTIPNDNADADVEDDVLTFTKVK